MYYPGVEDVDGGLVSFDFVLDELEVGDQFSVKYLESEKTFK